MLFIGLGIFFGTIALRVILYLCGIDVEGQSVVMEQIKDLMKNAPLMAALLCCLIMPACEEVSFRLWGLGKKWMTIVSLVLTSLYLLLTGAWYGLPIVIGMLVTWLKVKDRYRQLWINTLLSSTAFAMAHISGLGGHTFWTYATTLPDIFGLAMMLSWLTINLSFGFSILLHALNNSVVLIPMLFMPGAEPIYFQHELEDGDIAHTTIEGVALLHEKDYQSTSVSMPNEMFAEIEFCDEPGKIAARLLTEINETGDTAFFCRTAYRGMNPGEQLNEKVHYKVVYDKPRPYNAKELYRLFMQDYNKFGNGRELKRTIIETVWQEAWLHYADGREVTMDSLSISDPDNIAANTMLSATYPGKLMERGLFVKGVDDKTLYVKRYLVLDTTSQGSKLAKKIMERSNGFTVELRPTTDSCRVTVIR